MNFLARLSFYSQTRVRRSLALVFFLVFAACGVRGNPEPPLTPAELGRGKPTFTRSSDEFIFPTPTPAAKATSAPAAMGKAKGGE